LVVSDSGGNLVAAGRYGQGFGEGNFKHRVWATRDYR
jgi:hypothetical protein